MRSKTVLALMVLLLTICFGIAANFHVTPYTERVYTPIENLQFTTSSAGDDYIDSRYSIIYGTSVTDPPAGMGNLDAACTNMTEGSYSGTATIGQSTEGASYYTESANYLVGSVFTTGAGGGVVTDAHFYGNGLAAGNAKVVIVGHIAMTIITNGVSNPAAYDTLADWYTATWSTPPTLAASTEYVLMLVPSSTFKFNYYDTTAIGHIDTTNSYATPTNPTDFSHGNYKWSIYVNYAPTYYRFEAIFAFATVDYATYASEVLYFDFDVTSTAETVDIYGGTSTNPTTLIADSKNTDFSVDIHATLTGASYYIKIADELRATDLDADIWKVAKCYIKLTNAVPVNTACSADPDDTDNIYSQLKDYTYTVSTSDADGYAHISYVELTCLSSIGVYRWSARYTEDTNTFSENAIGADRFTLNTGSSSATRSGTTITAYFKIATDFYISASDGMPEEDNDDLQVFTVDADIASDQDTYDVNYDFISSLEMAGISFGDAVADASRGNLGGTVRTVGTVSYHGFSTRHPLASKTDIWVTSGVGGDNEYSQITGYTEATGIWNQSVTVNTMYLDHLQYTHTVVEQGAGSGGTSIVAATHDYTPYYTTDKVTVKTTISSDADGRVNAGGNVEVRATAWAEFDDTYLGSGDSVSLNGSAMSWDAANSWWELTVTKPTVSTWKYIVSSVSENQYGITSLDTDSKSVTITYERVNIDYSITKTWTVKGYSVSVTCTATYMSNSGAFGGTVNHNHAIGVITLTSVENRTWFPNSITDPTYGITVFQNDSVSCVWDDIEISSVAYFWAQYSVDQVWLLWNPSTYYWSFNSSGVSDSPQSLVQSYTNSSADDWALVYSSTHADLAIGPFNPSWYYVEIDIHAEITVAGVSYDWSIWSITLEVDILHSLQVVSFTIVPTDSHFWIQFQTNKMNSSITIWDDAIDSGTLFSDNIYHSPFEGMHQIARSDIIGAHNVTVCITSTGTEYDREYSVGDYVWWYNFTYIVSADELTAYIRIFDSYGDFVSFETFEIYRNGSRQYTDTFTAYTDQAWQISVKDRFGATLNTTTFADGTEELVVIVNIHSLKVQSWHHDYVFFNLTRSGITYREVIAPLEIVNFRLYQNTYTWLVDYRNGTTVSGSTTLTSSTAIVVTGSTITDLVSYSETLLSMTSSINVTLVSTQNQVLTISIDLSNVNSTINTQLVQLLLNITNTNTTLYSQTVDLLAALQNVNTTLYSQSVSVLAKIQNANMTLYNQTVSILTYVLNTNSTLYAQTITLLTEVDTIEEQAEIIEDVARQIYGDLPPAPEPTKTTTENIWALILKLLVGGVIILILAIILATVIRALLNDRRLKAPGGNEANAKTQPTVFLE